MTDIVINQVPGVRDPALGIDRGTPWGLLLHTTGGGVTDKAKRTGLTPLQVAIRTYIDFQNGSEGYKWGGPHYVLPHDGSIHQVAPDNLLMAHCGGQNRGRYFDGSWEVDAPSAVMAQWHQNWSPKYKHPYQLFPSMSPNHDYVGVEMIPCGDGFGTPAAPGLLFTHDQIDAGVALAQHLAAAHGWPAGWQATSRLLGHEDVDPLNRSNAGGGWDPGWLRVNHYFDFADFRAAI